MHINPGKIREALPHLVSIAASLSLLCLAGCQTTPVSPGSTLATDVAARQTAVDNSVRYEIRADRSDIRFLVFRAGALARLGHNHVVQARGVRGEVRLAPDIHQSSFSIEIPVKDFLVDEDPARLDEGAEFFPQPDAQAIAGTSSNMLGEQVLDAARYPTIEINSLALSGPAWGMDIRARIKLHGMAREMVIPVALEMSADELVVTAFFSIAQTDFGITPMSVFGGALQVDNTVKVRMRIVATRSALPGR